jgi:uncharacterized tellurite resistance protein B-like protein
LTAGCELRQLAATAGPAVDRGKIKMANDIPRPEADAGDILPAQVTTLLDKLARPARDVRQLRPEERRLAIAVLLASLVPADRKVRQVEINRLNALAAEHYRVTGISLAHIEVVARERRFSVSEMQAISAHVPGILNIEDRCALVGLLWEIALCDQELHALEEQAIYAIADRLEVPRKRTAEQQVRARQRV